MEDKNGGEDESNGECVLTPDGRHFVGFWTASP
jgi:hypothetical protein